MTDEATRLLAAARPAQFGRGTAVAPATRERELAATFSRDAAARQVPGAGRAAGTRPGVPAVRPRRRRHGAIGLAASGIAVAAGLSLALALALSLAGPGRSTPDASAARPELAAWTVRTSPGGIVTLTLRQAMNAPVLQHVLAAHGVRAIVRSGETICQEGDGAALPGLSRVVTHPRRQPPHSIVIQIRPGAMPARSELLVTITRVPGGIQQVGTELIRTGAPVSCLAPPPVSGR